MESKGKRSNAKVIDAVDVHVGDRIRIRRVLLGISQGELGAEAGVTFQQIQKYEKGTNRVSASRLQRLGDVLRVQVSYFFDGLPGQDGRESTEGHEIESMHLIRSPEAVQLNRAFHRIQSSDVRRKIVALMKAVATAGAEDDQSTY